MGLDVWFREDVARALRAARVAGQEARLGVPVWSGPENESDQRAVSVRSESREMAAYWHGYEAALATIGAAFGLIPGPRRTEVLEALDRGSPLPSFRQSPDAEAAPQGHSAGAWE